MAGTDFAEVQGWPDAVDASDLPAIPLFQVSMHMSIGPGGLFGGGPGWYQPRGPYGAYPGCGCSGIVMIMAGILLVLAGLMRGCNM